MKYLAFVTMEFYPLTTGEIGRYIHKMLVAMSNSDRARTVVILVGEALDLALVRTELGVSMNANCRNNAEMLKGEKAEGSSKSGNSRSFHVLTSAYSGFR